MGSFYSPRHYGKFGALNEGKYNIKGIRDACLSHRFYINDDISTAYSTDNDIKARFSLMLGRLCVIVVRVPCC
jgi:hypothetical protein